ncbi:4-(cytidine 5'-diphospho)-2-C-methyl-D-erythritol kinase [Magnetovibrio sp. PR-2]|uniref:4-(cytidine 5'-diphospho)-2-C-methyl-D-erythritol kinase n=1 Tax=Magnetovibrio sp. PR-2 TaxID=3120356 RepID=UPI002FCE131B
MTKAVLRQFAPAKINLYLHVTGQRDDGYHELDSLVVFADIGDVVEVRAGHGLSLDISGPFGADLKADEDNLVLKAARALAEQCHIKPHAALHLIKNLPVASGIGGGSADAAATLKALIQYWEVHVDDEGIHAVAHDVAPDIDSARAMATLLKVWRDDLAHHKLNTIGLSLGADVPVCLESRPVFMGGIGEKLELAPHMPRVWLVLVNPGVQVSTPDIFKARTGEFSRPDRFHEPPNDAQHLARLLSTRRNDLSAPAIQTSPAIQNVLSALDNTDGILLSRMSGSGATCFGLYTSQMTAFAAAAKISHMHPNWWCEAAEMLDSTLDF